jgi:RNA polymerase sigma factor (sigma-70 family)
MNDNDRLTEEFEAHRKHLRGVAYRMLGSLNEADDAVQESWLRLNRSETRTIDNLGGWLTRVIARVCLDMLRARKSRREQPLSERVPDSIMSQDHATDPEHEALLASSVGLALLVVLDRLAPAERVAFVLHDLFAVPFDEIGEVVGRSQVASKKLASRARDRVRGVATGGEVDLARHHAVVEAFLAAARGGDLNALIELLAPDVVRRADRFAVPSQIATEVRGAPAVADETRTYIHRARSSEVALVDGRPGIVVAPHGRLFAVMRMSTEHGRITEIDVIADPSYLSQIPLALAG